ncbi:MAG: tRNA threonylcarbamoyladenosine dehydratase [Erysipelotrichaceae bacterium]|nr:tRNA threonylcarbamoyladenosine dehydratase [Erysipelotrichaceae bacterium]
MEEFIRTELIIGKEALVKMAKARVAVFGVGGVGGYAVEGLARTGIGTLDLIDNDDVALSNINRQIIATQDSVGLKKVDVAKRRVLSINPNITVNTYDCFYLPEKRDQFDFAQYDYIVDAIDTVTAKLDIIETAKKLDIPIISAMGCGNRLDPTKVVITDIYKTYGDPLAKIMRKELKERRIKKLDVVYSTEKPLKPLFDIKEIEKDSTRRSIPGSSAFVPSAAGLAIAYFVTKKICEID